MAYSLGMKRLLIFLMNTIFLVVPVQADLIDEYLEMEPTTHQGFEFPRIAISYPSKLVAVLFYDEQNYLTIRMEETGQRVEKRKKNESARRTPIQRRACDPKLRKTESRGQDLFSTAMERESVCAAVEALDKSWRNLQTSNRPDYKVSTYQYQHQYRFVSNGRFLTPAGDTPQIMVMYYSDKSIGDGVLKSRRAHKLPDLRQIDSRRFLSGNVEKMTFDRNIALLRRDVLSQKKANLRFLNPKQYAAYIGVVKKRSRNQMEPFSTKEFADSIPYYCLTVDYGRQFQDLELTDYRIQKVTIRRGTLESCRDKLGHNSLGGPSKQYFYFTKAEAQKERSRIIESGEIVERSPKPKLVTKPKLKQKGKPTLISTGTGFAVNKDYVVTANHVVDDCTSVRILYRTNAIDVQVVGKDVKNDLGLLRTAKAIHTVAKLRGGKQVRLGERVANYGYPLFGQLSTTATITEGNVNNLSGPGNNSKIMQFDAPTQPGNSGGPVVDGSGNVVGVAIQILSKKYADATGHIAQNVNFAIKSTALENFLKLHKVSFEKGNPTEKLELPDIAERAEKFTVLVGCWK